MRRFFVWTVWTLIVMVGAIGCDRMQQVVQPVDVEVVEGPAFYGSADGNYLVNAEPEDMIQVLGPTGTIDIGGPKSSPVIGTGLSYHEEFHGDGHIYIQGSLEKDIQGSDFGASVAIHEVDYLFGVGDYPALVAVGAPNADNGRGAVYVFRVGEKGLWFERKITAHSNTKGFGRNVEFQQSPDGKWHLGVGSDIDLRDMPSFPIEYFMMIG